MSHRLAIPVPRLYVYTCIHIDYTHHMIHYMHPCTTNTVQLEISLLHMIEHIQIKHIYMYIYIYISMYVYVHIELSLYIYIYTQLYTHIQTIYIYIYIIYIYIILYCYIILYSYIISMQISFLSRIHFTWARTFRVWLHQRHWTSVLGAKRILDRLENLEGTMMNHGFLPLEMFPANFLDQFWGNIFNNI